MTLDTLGLQAIGTQLFTLLIDPMSDLSAALVLYAIVGTLLSILLVIAIMFIVSSDDDEEEHDPLLGAAPTALPDTPAGDDVQDPDTPPPVAPSTPSTHKVAALGLAVMTLVVVWLVAGYTTSVSPLCSSCHVETAHTLSQAAIDPHAGVECVACHERGGLASRLTVALPMRTAHIVAALTGSVQEQSYGMVTPSACRSCHGTQVDRDVLNEPRGIRMSHDEPLDEGASCLDCHTIQDGVVAGHNAGMEPCMRCHNQVVASSDCALCHVGEPAASASIPATFQPAALIEDLSCGGCHNEARYCDPCHNGIRLPHSTEFMVYAHARPAQVNFWSGRGTSQCQPCHTETRRPCTECHTQFLGIAHSPSLRYTHQAASEAACDTCHQEWAYAPERNFCADVCHTPAAYRYSPP